MKKSILSRMVCCLFAASVTALADSYVTVPNTGERAYRTTDGNKGRTCGRRFDFLGDWASLIFSSVDTFVQTDLDYFCIGETIQERRLRGAARNAS